MLYIRDIIAKKKDGGQLKWEEIEYVMKAVVSESIREAQLAAFLMVCHLNGVSGEEIEFFIKAMMFSGQQLSWPQTWRDKLVVLQSLGTTGNKVRLLVAACVTSCGLKFPVLPARGLDTVGGILYKAKVIPGLYVSLSHDQVEKGLDEVGMVLARQSQDVAPAERLIRDIASVIGIYDSSRLHAACMIARMCALRIKHVVIEVTCGPGENIKTRHDAQDMATTIKELSKLMGIKCKVLLTRLDGPVGRMVGQALEISEMVRCLNGEGPSDLQELVCKLGSHVLHLAEVVPTVAEGYEMVEKCITSGAAKKQLQGMLQIQGVNKADIKSLFKVRKDENAVSPVLPSSQYFTHLSAEGTGFVHRIDTAILNAVMYDMATSNGGGVLSAGGVQLLVQVGSFLNRGEVWARLHHNTRLPEHQVDRLKSAISLQLDTPLYDMSIDITEVS